MLKRNNIKDSWLSSSSSNNESKAQDGVKSHLCEYSVTQQIRETFHKATANAAAFVGRPPIHQNDDYSANQQADFGDNGPDYRYSNSYGNSPPTTSDRPLSQMQMQMQMQQQATRYLSQQKHLRQVERRLRSSLNLSTILGTTVVETAALFKARQVSLLRYCSANQNWQQVAQFCNNQSLAWRQPFTISQVEFPHLMQQLRHGKSLRLLSGQLSPLVKTPSDVINAATSPFSGETPTETPTSPLAIKAQITAETRQWLACWSGHWLLVPIKNRPPANYSLSRALEHTVSDTHLADRSATEEMHTSFTDVHSEDQPHKRPKEKQDTHWGFMALAFPEQKVWSASAIAAAQSIALELSLAMEQAHQYQTLVMANQELQKLALSDGLTRLANRRRFDEHLNNEWQRLARDQQPLSLILCDLDHFKRYNDSYGHPAGDRCLIRVARALLNGPQRPADLVARYGGEEFAIILPNTDTQGAWRIAQKVHESIRALRIAHAPHHEEAYVTVTMGVSTVVPGHDTTAQMLVQASDLALYHAKQQGRNRTYIHAHYNTIDPDTVIDTREGSGPTPKMTPSEEKPSV